MTIIQQGGSVGRSVMVSSSGNNNNNNSSSSNGGKKKKLGQSCNSSSPLLLSQQEEGMVAAVNGEEVILGSGGGSGGGGGGGGTGSSIVGLSSPGKTFCNLVISIVGAGVLGLPYAFKASGWLEASLILCALSLAMYYCMMLLVRSRRRMETDWGVGSVSTYSNLGFHAFGTAGQAAVDAMVLLSQGGFCIAYLIFIGENLASVFTRQDSLSTPAADLLPNSQQMGAAAAASDLMGSMWKLQWKTKEIYIWIVFPLQLLLACIRSLTNLAPFSMFADVVNLVSMAVVMATEFTAVVTNHGEHVRAFSGMQGLLFTTGVAIYTVEGITLVLPLESEIDDRSKFGSVIGAAMVCVTLLYTVFGLLGYFAFGEYTKDIITLNLGNTWQTTIVKLGLCTGLLFTYPVMMTPVYELMERRLIQGHPSVLLRSVLVLATAWTAVAVPHFGNFLSLVGSSVCCFLSFVLPASIHLQVFGQSLSWIASAADYLLVAFGIIFAVLGTWASIHNMM